MTNSTITLTTKPGRPWNAHKYNENTIVEVTTTLTELEKVVETVTSLVEDEGSWFFKYPQDTVEFHARVIAYINESEKTQTRNLMALLSGVFYAECIAKETLELIVSSHIANIDHNWVPEIINDLKATLEIYDTVTV